MTNSLHAEFFAPVIRAIARSTGRRGWRENFLKGRNLGKMDEVGWKALVDEAIEKLRIIRLLDEMHRKGQSGEAAVAAFTAEAAKCRFTLLSCGITEQELKKLGQEPPRKVERRRFK